MQFNNAQVTISGQTILAQSINIEESNSISPAYAVGYRGAISDSPSGPVSNRISFNYILEPTDINYKLLQNIRNYDFNSFPVALSVAGLNGAGYLSSYSLNIRENDVITASVSYNIYEQLTGQLSEQPSNFYSNYNLSKGSGVAHSWTSYAKTNNGNSTGSILSLNYNFQSEVRPVYKIGRPTPIEVKYLNSTESFEITSEHESRITYSGQTFTGKFNDIEIIEIGPISGLWNNVANGSKIFLYPNSGKITSNSVDIGENDIIVNQATVIKYY